MLGDEDVNLSLIRAVRSGRLERARELINSFGLSYSNAWAKGYVLLCHALKNKHTEVAKLLLTSGSKVNSKNSKINACYTALHFAVSNGDIDIVEMILDKGADVDAKNQFRQTPLGIAFRSKRMEIARLLLKHGADLSVLDNGVTSLLHVAAEIGCSQTVERLLRNGVYVDCISTSRGNKGYTPLHFAAESGNEEVITLLLNKGATVDGKAEDGITPLHIAAHKGHAPIVKELLKYGACIHSLTSNKGYTPLYFATETGHEAVVKLLLQHGAKVDDQDKDGKTTLYLAVEKGCLTIVEDLLKYCPDINNPSNRSSLKIAVQGSGGEYKKIVEAILEYGFSVNPQDANDSKFLHAAVKKGSLKIIEDLLKYGADVNTLHDSIFKGFTPLHTAVENKQAEVAELLISYGADINARDEYGKTPIFYAMQNADLKLTELLLTYGANVKDNPELLSIAVEKKCIEIVKALLQHDVDINASDKYGRTALHFTAFSGRDGLSGYRIGCRARVDPDITGREEIAKLLLSKGANVNCQTKLGATPLHAATDKGYAKVVAALLECNANVNSAADYNITPLHLSARRGNEEISRMLLNKGAYINAKEKNGSTALRLAIRAGDKALVKLLLEYGAKVDSKDENDVTPLHISAAIRNEEISRMLLNKGADINAKGKNEFTALRLATQAGDELVVKLLLEYGAKVDSKNKSDITPLHVGADINCRDKYSRTALHLASQQGHTKIVAHLLEYGSDINITSSDDCTPLDYAMPQKEVFVFDDYDSDDAYDDGSDEEYDNIVVQRQEIAEVLKHHIVKMKIANLYVSEKNLRLVSSSSAMNDFRDECEEEIAGMKNEKINNTNISFYDILAKRTSSLAIYMRNENIVQVLKSDDYKTKFPIYASMIKSHFRNSMKRKEFLEKGKNVFHFLFPELQYDCSERIFSYLSNEDLKILIDACKPLSISNPNTNINDVAITSNVSEVQYA